MLPRSENIQMEFHVSRRARDRYQFDQSIFAVTGNAIFTNFYTARLFAEKMNSRRNLVNFPEQAVKAGQINAMGLIHEILHYVTDTYRQGVDPGVMGQALAWIDAKLGKAAVDETLRHFADEFPPAAVYRRETDVETYLEGETEGVPHRQMLLEEMALLWLANVNPAFSPYNELFDDTVLEKETAYRPVMQMLHQFLDTRPPYGPDQQNLLDMLRSPAVAVPHSLAGQLGYIQEHWGSLLGKHLYLLLKGVDLIKEEQKMSFLGPGPSQVYDYSEMIAEQAAGLAEPERFSRDLDWMPNLVLIAKSAYVWLEQLARQYHCPIQHLDDVPDAELQALSRWGFSGLWLIGLWERSPASKKIKELFGQTDAVASAYSLFDYEIASDLGGEAAYQNLKARAGRFGIRLASDMVPNHMGIDSRWVMEHPDWFISLDHSPFPSYTFDGPDLSWNPDVGIYLEDHYYHRTDAAVVFKHLDRRAGSERYAYHGNDGTSMPWNDTAQLDYLKAEVREAVIQTILRVAQKFPIIRFDAAMTLAKKHYERLWYPVPGTGGAIPSRTEYGISKAEFDALIPEEFWREVVDRIAQEVPETLLLAEAFWMMEGYFVRTLGMHRVYNSAFMNMLKDEENGKYRAVIKNTIEFNPEILKRFVNFMNNPDEETAVVQFGKGDKYFGVCTLMSTMPGLPMFGHGQIQGFAEKYGMEYRQAKWEEPPDTGLIQRHEREIFPLLRRRYLFAEVENFLLYDLFTPAGQVNEDVFAYSNLVGEERSLVIYHNRYASAQGWIRTSVAYSAKIDESDERTLVQRTLGEGLGLQLDGNMFCIYRDHVTGLEYIRNNLAIHEQGLYVDIGAYKYHVYLDMREVQDDETHHYGQLAAYLDGQGVPSIEEALKEIFLQPVHQAFKALVNPATLRRLLEAFARPSGGATVGPAATEPAPEETTSDQPGGNQLPEQEISQRQDLLKEVEQQATVLLQEARRYSQGTGDETAIAQNIRRSLEVLLALPAATDQNGMESATPSPATAQTFAAPGPGNPYAAGNSFAGCVLLGWIFVHPLGRIANSPDYALVSRSWIDEWTLGRILATTFQEVGLGEDDSWRAVAAIKLLTSHQNWYSYPSNASLPTSDMSRDAGEGTAYRVLVDLLQDAEVQQYIQVNRYKGILWFNKEAFDQLLVWLQIVSVVKIGADPSLSAEEVKTERTHCAQIIKQLQEAEEQSEYQVEQLLAATRISVN
ncbi:MAG: alpha-amylase [Chloroflexi bacterium]|nr:alpha-amylase [Chloroflexota bacterium]